MKKTKQVKLMQGLLCVSATLFAVLLSGTALADSYKGYINSTFGTSNYEKKTREDAGTVDSAYFKSDYTSLKDMYEAKVEVAKQLSEEGSVLLKNDNAALPLAKNANITLWGMNSSSPTLGGLVGSNCSAAGKGEKLYGFVDAFQEHGFKLNQKFIDLYNSDAAQAYLRKSSFFGNVVPGHGLIPAFTPAYDISPYDVGEIPSSMYTQDILNSADATTAVVVISRDSSEAGDYGITQTSKSSEDSFVRPLALSTNEKEMIELAKAHSTKVVVLINASNPMEIEDLKNDKDIDSIMWVGTPGEYGLCGVADVLDGTVNPSGGLTDTYAVNSASSPAMQNYGLYFYSNYSKGSNPELTTDDKADWYVCETEGIYVGYKYYETRYEDSVLGNNNASGAYGTDASTWKYEDEVTYPFGYGLSYTTFEKTLETVEVNVGGTGVAKVKVKNTGEVAGKTSVQLYVQTPYTKGGIEKSSVQLLDFTKTDILQPGEEKEYEVTFDPKYMASYDEDHANENGTKGAWVLDEGKYYFSVGNGAHEALNNILANKGATNLVKTTENDVYSKTNAIEKTLSYDATTYSENVQNQLQDADINNLIDNAVEYTTRSDWSKGWKSVENLTPTKEMMVGLTNSTYQLTENGKSGDVVWGKDNGLKIADFIQLDDNGNYVGTLDFDDSKWDDLLDQVTLDEAINWVANGGEKTIEEFNSLTMDVAIWNDGPIGVAPDQQSGYTLRWTDANSTEPTYVKEGDTYSDYSLASMPTEPVVASTFNKELVEKEGEMFGEDSLWSNINSLCGPGMNLHRSPYCARNFEYYSEDSMLTNIMGAAVCKGGKTKGMMMMPKHLAFNHQELNRSGVSTFFNEQAGRENELRCFEAVLGDNVAQGVMTAFNRIGTVYAGGYENVQENIVRGEWGFIGWNITDMINGAEYMNWRDIVLGGGGMACTETAYASSAIGEMAASKTAISKDYNFQAKMKKQIKYYVYSVANSNYMNGITSNTYYVYKNTWWQNTLIVADVVLGVLTVGAIAGYVLTLAKKKED